MWHNSSNWVLPLTSRSLGVLLLIFFFSVNGGCFGSSLGFQLASLRSSVLPVVGNILCPIYHINVHDDWSVTLSRDPTGVTSLYQGPGKRREKSRLRLAAAVVGVPPRLPQPFRRRSSFVVYRSVQQVDFVTRPPSP